MNPNQKEEVLKAHMEALQNQERFFAERSQRKTGIWRDKLYRTPLKLKQRRVGSLRIEHETWKKGRVVDIVSMREAICTGKSLVQARLPRATRIHKLIDDKHGLWMTDMPCELNQMAEGVFEACTHGRVLIGGLGLGIQAGLVRDMRRELGVTEITVVEKSRNVIELCAAPGYAVARCDLYAMLESCKQYDTFLLDTWQGQGEACYLTEVLPAIRIIRNRFGKKPSIWCWKEEEMQGQVYRSLRSPFRAWKYSKLPPAMSHEEALFFLSDVGTKEWEEKYGALVERSRK